jgi:hypothetical protein
MKMEQSVPKRRHIKLRRWGFTKEKANNIQRESKQHSEQEESLKSRMIG